MNQNDINLVGDYSSFMEEYIDADLEHFGVPKMRWHHRRWQYPDGSLTPAGRDHYGVGPPRAIDPEHPITSRMAKAAQGFKERRAIAKIYAEKEARDKRLQDGKKAAKFRREQRAREVKEMTRTPDDLVKNRDKLTDEEFNAAVEKFEKLKQRDADNQAILKKYNGLKDDSPKEDPEEDEYEDYDGESGPFRVNGLYRPGRKYQNPDGTLTEEGKAKLASEREQQVAKWTETAEDLVKNRDRLTDEEFKQAVLRFDNERTKKLENEAILRAFGNGNDYEARRQARSAEKVAEAYRKYNAKELLNHKGEFTKEEFDQLKVLVASKSTSDLKKLTTYLSADEYQTALNRYAKTEGARKGQVVQDLQNAGKNVKSVVDMIDQGYKVMDTASKMTTGRSIQDLAKNATGTAFMSLIEKADLDTALDRAKAAEAASDSAKAVVGGVKDVMERAKNMTDKEYAEAMSPYYDSVMDILTGNTSSKNDKKNNKGGKNQNPNQQQTKQDQKQDNEPFPDYKEEKGSSNAQQQTSKKDKKKEQQAAQEKKDDKSGRTGSDDADLKSKVSKDEPQKPKEKDNDSGLTGFDAFDHITKPSIYTFGKVKNVPTLSFDDPEPPKQQTKTDKKKATTTKTDDPFAGIDLSKPSINFGSSKTEKAPTLSFDTPSQTKKGPTKTSNDNQSYYVPHLTFGDNVVDLPKVKPMTSKEYDDVMSKLANDVAEFQRKTNIDYKPNVTVDDVYDEVMRKLRG